MDSDNKSEKMKLGIWILLVLLLPGVTQGSESPDPLEAKLCPGSRFAPRKGSRKISFPEDLDPRVLNESGKLSLKLSKQYPPSQSDLRDYAARIHDYVLAIAHRNRQLAEDLGIEPEDLHQEAMRYLMERFPQWRIERGKSWSNWFHTGHKHFYYDKKRERSALQSRNRSTPFSQIGSGTIGRSFEDTLPMDRAAEGVNRLEFEELLGKLKGIRLSPKEIKVLRHFYADEMSPKDIAEAVGSSESEIANFLNTFKEHVANGSIYQGETRRPEFLKLAKSNRKFGRNPTRIESKQVPYDESVLDYFYKKYVLAIPAEKLRSDEDREIKWSQYEQTIVSNMLARYQITDLPKGTDEALQTLFGDKRMQLSSQQIDAWILSVQVGNYDAAPSAKSIGSFIMHRVAFFSLGKWARPLKIPGNAVTNANVKVGIIEKAYQRFLAHHKERESLSLRNLFFVENKANGKIDTTPHQKEIFNQFLEELQLQMTKFYSQDGELVDMEFFLPRPISSTINPSEARRRTAILLRHFLLQESAGAIAKREGVTKELPRQAIQKADKRMHEWLVANGDHISGPIVDANPIAQAFFKRNARTESLSPDELLAAEEALREMPPDVRNRLDGLRGKYSSVRSEGSLLSKKLDPLRDLYNEHLFAILAYRAFPDKTFPFEPKEAYPLIRLWHSREKVGTLPTAADFVDELEAIQEKLKKLDAEDAETYRLLYLESLTFSQIVPRYSMDDLRRKKKKLIKAISN